MASSTPTDGIIKVVPRYLLAWFYLCVLPVCSTCAFYLCIVVQQSSILLRDNSEFDAVRLL
ncbi:hypothetical protein [Leptolyngbya ohadii]|uniref:hypothetical protein n=1 Tax=Leptolyngbya ohadii TaxID=1962290 RepID=UPI0019D434A9|nr:hypothetical protein [Leptolyngbya ohadii]